jgi:hypothetical protein
MMRRGVPLLAPLALLAAVATLTLASSAGKALPPTPQPSCSPGPADCGAWHTSNVTVSWSGGVCGSVTITTDGATSVPCTVSDGSGSITVSVLVRRDATPPSVRSSAERGPDNNGWYNHAVSIGFEGDDGTSGVASCTSATYSGPDTGQTTVGGSCVDNAGNRGSGGYELKYDATGPSVEAKPDRPPDGNGWYRRAVTVAFVGSDATSGVESCAAPVRYQGPDVEKTSLLGSCQDKAANRSQDVGFELRYDTKPPTLGRIRAEIARGRVVLRWRASKDTSSFAVIRRPGVRGAKPTTVYAGRATAFTDRRTKTGVKYHYTFAAYDEAGNAAVKGLLVKPDGSVAKAGATKPATNEPAAARPALTRPAVGARVTAPPLLAWRAVPRATYYNVQLYRAGRKILTVWPGTTSFKLERSWRFDGRTYRLSPGLYRWYVWPGFGPRSATRYGKLLGTRTFVVTR